MKLFDLIKKLNSEKKEQTMNELAEHSIIPRNIKEPKESKIADIAFLTPATLYFFFNLACTSFLLMKFLDEWEATSSYGYLALMIWGGIGLIGVGLLTGIGVVISAFTLARKGSLLGGIALTLNTIAPFLPFVAIKYF